MTDSAVSRGCGRAEMLGSVAWAVPSTGMAGAVGLMGVAGRPCCAYQAKTGPPCQDAKYVNTSSHALERKTLLL
jgi:hypothetical protein